jgi:hypothetical protein
VTRDAPGGGDRLSEVSRARTRALHLFGALALALASTMGGAVGGCSTFSGESGTDGGNDAASSESSPDAELGTDGAIEDAAAADATGDSAHVPSFALGCGTATCTTPGDGCCWDYGTSGTAGYSCADAGVACPVSRDRRFTCDDNDDCMVLGFAGAICCGTLYLANDSYSLLSTACTTPANCAGPSDLQLCDRTVGGECANGQPCIDRTTFPQPNGAVGTWTINPSVPACGP